MNNLLSTWAAMDNRKRLTALLAVIALMTTLTFLYKSVATPSMALLYSGIDPTAARDIVSALEQRNVAFEVRGDSIYVDQNERDPIRLQLAGEGLPENGIQGYELLDKLAGFGTTNQMFDAAYWRAQEGELARTILATPKVRSARVHIANAVNRPFETENVKTASVTVTLTGGTLGQNHANAIRYLVASSVSGLLPENVTIIDAAGGIVLAAGKSEITDQLNARADDRALQLQKGLERLLGARVGAGNAVVQVNVDLNGETENVIERSFDPEKKVAVSTETEETTASATGSSPGNVTVASNLPDGQTGGGGQSNTNNNVAKERVNYEVSETTREITRAAGNVKRISAAILVDGISSADGAGVVTWQPRTAEELDALTSLIKSAIGFDESRGDSVTVSSMEFTRGPVEGTLAEGSIFDLFAVNVIKLLQLSVLGLVVLVLGLFVVRPVLSSTNPQQLLPAPTIPAIPSPQEVKHLPDMASESKQSEDPVTSLRGLVSERSEDSSKVIKGWIDAQQPVPGVV